MDLALNFSGGNQMPAKGLVCNKCGRTFPLAPIYFCRECGGILIVDYDNEKLDIDESNHNIMSRYSNFLPIDIRTLVSLGEGDTPLTRAPQLAKWLGIKELLIKNEGCNPTGSFKDRPISIGISKARDFGFDTVVIASSGNAGASVGAYAAKAGLRSIVMVPEGTPLPKILQTLSYGAQIVMVKGNFSFCFNLAKKAAENLKWANLATTFLNPFTTEGNKSIAYEIIEDMRKKVPDVIAIPLGAGPLLAGIWWGFKDLYKLGHIKKLPRLIGVQAEMCAPIAKAFAENGKVQPWRKKYKTKASGIADSMDGYSSEGDLVIDIVKESRGFITTVTESEIEESVYVLAQLEGIYAEPSGAVTVKAVQKMANQGWIKPSDCVVAIVTGNGLKDSVSKNKQNQLISTVESYDDLVSLINKSKCQING